MEKDSITITISGKTWKGKPEEFAEGFDLYLAQADERMLIGDAILAFLQSYGE